MLKNTNSQIYLLKQFKKLKFKEEVLISVYRSLTLSHFNYSASLLISTIVQTQKNKWHNTRSSLKYNILSIHMNIERSFTNTLERILNDLPQPKHYSRNSRIRIIFCPFLDSSSVENNTIMKRGIYRNPQ